MNYVRSPTVVFTVQNENITKKGIDRMNNLQIWNYEGTEVRTVEVNGEPWFVGKDVATVLGYVDIGHAILDHVDEEDRVNSKTQGHFNPEFGQRGTWLINESGVYALIFGSKLPTAKKFKHWVTSEVLPSIRQTGSYGIDTTLTPELQVLIQHERMMQEQQKQLDEVQDKIDAIQDTFLLQPEDWKKETRIAIGKLSQKICGNYSMIHELYQQSYALLEDRAGADLNARVRNKKARMAENGATKKAIDAVSTLDIISDDKKLKEIFTAILREMSAKNI